MSIHPRSGDLEPLWPKTAIKPCSVVKIGCEREGSKSETYKIHLVDSESQKHHCEFPQSKWKSIAVGTQRKMNFRVVDGGIDCDSWDQ